jgi:hypothetical protein
MKVDEKNGKNSIHGGKMEGKSLLEGFRSRLRT